VGHVQDRRTDLIGFCLQNCMLQEGSNQQGEINTILISIVARKQNTKRIQLLYENVVIQSHVYLFSYNIAHNI
jgi:hypothetical protein